jgi:hypothetical protein
VLLIREIVRRSLATSFLTIETELQLCQLFAVSKDLEDIEAMTELRQAIASGQVKRQLSMKAPASVAVKQLA